MGIFSFLNRKSSQNGHALPPEEEAAEPEIAIPEDPYSLQGRGINILYAYFEINHEKKGYDDALVNADSTHLAHNTEALKNEMERKIRKVKTFYEDFIREIDFHINSRARSGMVDTVEQLTMKKNIAESHIRKVLEIEQDLQNDRGESQGVILSYTRGFRNGLAAISHNNILKTKF